MADGGSKNAGTTVSDIKDGTGVVSFPSPPENGDHLKTLTVVVDKSRLSTVQGHSKGKGGKQKSPLEDLSIYTTRVEYSAVDLCPLYRKHGVNHFMVFSFGSFLAPKVIEAILVRGVRVKVGEAPPSLYRFYGHSKSQLQARKCVMYSQTLEEPTGYQGLPAAFGNFNKINNVSKRATRLGLLLSPAETRANLREDQIARIPDIEHGGYNFTDGCGVMSLATAREVVDSLTEIDRAVYYSHPCGVPSVIQVRVKGCKGVLVLDTSLAAGILIRPSMEKFDWVAPGPHPLGVTSSPGWSRPNTLASLNVQFIRLLSALGVPDQIFLDKQRQHLGELSRLTEISRSDRDLQFKHLMASGYYYQAERLLVDKDPDARTIKILNKLKRHYYTKSGGKPEKAVKLHIPLEESRTLYGVADPTGTLEYGTCFLQITSRGRPTVLDGMKVVVSKTPCYHPGDIRVLTCVNLSQCRHLVDCIVFPTKGTRPHADEIAGSDLDGDQFFVCWDKDLIPPQTVSPTSYQGSSAKDKAHITQLDLIQYFAGYKSSIGILDRLYTDWVNSRGPMSQECLLIASLFNQEIDAAKTGKMVAIPKVLKEKAEREGIDKYVWENMVDTAKAYLKTDTTTEVTKLGQDKAEKGSVKYVWEKMKDNTGAYLDDVLCGAASREDCMSFSRDDIEDILQRTSSRVSEYHLYRLTFRWCQGSNRMDLLPVLLKRVQFARMTSLQRKMCLTDLEGCPNVDSRITQNALHQSSILKESDIFKLKGAQEKAWFLYHRSEGDQMPWGVLNDVCTSEYHKLLVFSFKKSGQTWVIAVSTAEKMALYDMVPTSQTHVPTVVYWSIHSDNLSGFLGKLPGTYVMALDGERLQIFDTMAKKGVRHQGRDPREKEVFIDRTQTFVCLMDLESEQMGMSVALQRFHNRAPFEMGDGNTPVNLRREAVVGVEVFLRHCDPMVAPSIIAAGRHQEQFNDMETHEPPTCLPPKDFYHFPELGAAPEMILPDMEIKKQRLWLMYFDLKRRLDSGNLQQDDVSSLIAFMVDTPELESEAASMLEFLSYTSDRNIIGAASSYVNILLTLLRHPNNGKQITRFFGTMMERNVKFSAGLLLDITESLIFCCPDRELSVTVMNELRGSCEQLLDQTGFQTQTSLSYFVYFLTFVTIELLEAAHRAEISCREAEISCAQTDTPCRQTEGHANNEKNVEDVLDKLTLFEDAGAATRTTPVSMGRPFVDVYKEGDQQKTRVILNMDGSYQPFTSQDALALSCNEAGERRPFYFAEITGITGTVLNIQIIWPKNGEVGLASDLQARPDALWRVDLFPSLVSHRRQVEALKRACLVGTGSSTCEVVKEIVKCHIDGTSKTLSLYVLNIIALYLSFGLVLLYICWCRIFGSKLHVLTINVQGQEERESSISMQYHRDGAQNVTIAANSSEKENPQDEWTCVKQKGRRNKKGNKTAVLVDHTASKVPDRSMKMDEQQQGAVTAARKGPVTIIKGPPGSGKTLTASFVVQQWLKDADKQEKILVTAYTNRAINQLMIRLLQIIPRDQVICMGMSQSVPPDMRDLTFEEVYDRQATSTSERNQLNRKLAAKILKAAKVVCAVCLEAGCSVLQDVHFSYVMMDEASQIQEPSSLIPLILGARNLCLAGDEMGLPPPIVSQEAKPLSISLFTRLQKAGFPVHALKTQYRMHPKLAWFPFKQFYTDRLESKVRPSERLLPDGICWPDEHIPVAFYPLESREKYVGQSMSNHREADVVVQKVMDLISADHRTQRGVKEEDIAVITPFTAQEEKLKNLFKEKRVDVEVYTIDGFQGQERDVIVFSPVRANCHKETGRDPIRHVGVLSDPHRFNLLLTRAKRGLIVVGHMDTLGSDPMWREWLNHLNNNNLICPEVQTRDQSNVIYRGTQGWRGGPDHGRRRGRNARGRRGGERNGRGGRMEGQNGRGVVFNGRVGWD